MLIAPDHLNANITSASLRWFWRSRCADWSSRARAALTERGRHGGVPRIAYTAAPALDRRGCHKHLFAISATADTNTEE